MCSACGLLGDQDDVSQASAPVKIGRAVRLMRDCGLLSSLRRRPAQRLCLLDNRLSRRHGAERRSTGGRGWSKAAPVVVSSARSGSIPIPGNGCFLGHFSAVSGTTVQLFVRLWARPPGTLLPQLGAVLLIFLKRCPFCSSGAGAPAAQRWQSRRGRRF